MKQVLLWLDDLRNPLEAHWLANYSPIRDYWNCEIVWVKSYEAFVDYIKQNGLPDGICFDHDLGQDIASEKVSMGMSKKQSRREKKGTKTGKDCANFLIEYCMDNKLKLPLYNIQSANICGKENIDGLLKSYLKNVEHENA